MRDGRAEACSGEGLAKAGRTPHRRENKRRAEKRRRRKSKDEKREKKPPPPSRGGGGFFPSFSPGPRIFTPMGAPPEHVLGRAVPSAAGR